VRVRLLTESCTKGWLSWGLGELWLTDDAMVRVGRSELTLRATGIGPLSGALAAATRPVAWMTPSPSTAADIAPDVWTAYLRERTDDIMVVPLAQIASARLKGGLFTSALAMRLLDGTTRKLLWSRAPGVIETLWEHLPRQR
jgi:hypothetical protein